MAKDKTYISVFITSRNRLKELKEKTGINMAMLVHKAIGLLEKEYNS